MRAVNQPHVSSARSQKERAEQKPLVSQEFFDLHNSKRRMLLSWDFGMADGGCDPFYARWNAREPLGQQPPGVAQIARDTPADDLPHQG
jgi:hypothetical protein